MTIYIGNGISIGGGISIDYGGPTVVTSGLMMELDAANYSGSGTNWPDSTGNGYYGTLINSPAYSSNNGGYFTFVPASVQYASVNNAPLNPTAYTKSAWFYLNGYNDNNLIGNSTGGHFMFFGGTNRMYSGHSNWVGFPFTYQSVSTFSLGTWYNATLTFNTTAGMALYVNGVLDSTYTAQLTPPAGGQTNVAAYSAGGNLLDGRIAVALIYNRVLTAGEVLQNYNAQKSRFGL